MTVTASVRTDIQGLRALAVALVVGFHLAPSLIHGGYIGVDVFFVISGFLITGHLLREAERDGRIRVTRFWARRVRRLLPAAFAVLLVSAIAAFIWMPRSLLIQNLSEMGLAGLYVLNWGLAANSVDYLAAGNVPSMAQHFWSLSVEEQFYLVWPLIVVAVIWIAARVKRMPLRRALGIALTIIIVASLAFSIIETARSQASAYFITTTRAWEFALGGLVAVLPAWRPHRAAHAALSWVGLAAIVGAGLVFDEETAFPGWIALIPVGATALLIWVGDSRAAYSPQFFAQWRPIQVLGDISYAVYLWHWPLVVLVTTLQWHSPGKLAAIGIGVASILLGLVTKRFIEDPFRASPGPLARPRVAYSFMAAGMVVVSLVTLLPAQGVRAANAEVAAQTRELAADPSGCFGAAAILNDCADPYATTATVNAAVTADDQIRTTGIVADVNLCPVRLIADNLEVHCTLAPKEGSNPHVVLVGDSHAEALATPFAEVARAEGWYLEMHSRASCSGFLDPAAAQSGSDVRCTEWAADLYGKIAQDTSIRTVIIANRAPLYRGDENSALAEERIRTLQDAGKRVVVVHAVPGTQTPWPVTEVGEKAPTCVERTGGDAGCAWNPPTEPDWMQQAAASTDADVVDPWDVLCQGGTCHVVIGGTIVYFDETHLATTFALSMVPWFTEQLAPLVR